MVVFGIDLYLVLGWQVLSVDSVRLVRGFRFALNLNRFSFKDRFATCVFDTPGS